MLHPVCNIDQADEQIQNTAPSVHHLIYFLLLLIEENKKKKKNVCTYIFILLTDCFNNCLKNKKRYFRLSIAYRLL